MSPKRMDLFGSEEQFLYHGSDIRITNPEVRVSKYYKDFGFGFYCTRLERQAKRWVHRRHKEGFVNKYSFQVEPSLRHKIFVDTTDEWLDFVIHCRTGGSHSYDIVEGPMADDTVFTAIQDYLDGTMPREVLIVTLRFVNPTHQISFHTDDALSSLRFRGAYYEAHI